MTKSGGKKLPICPVCDEPVYRTQEMKRMPEHPEAGHSLGKEAHRKCAEGDDYKGVGSDEPDGET